MSADAPIQSYRTLRRLVPKSLHPYLRGIRKRLTRPALAEPYRTVFSYTQAHATRQENLVRLAHEIDDLGILGAIVECGVLDGGTAALMACSTKSRPVHLFDSWEGLPEITAEDGDAGMWAGDVVGSPRRVVSVFKSLGIDMSRVTFHKGWFDQTFPVAKIDRVAILHVDGDFYQSVKISLEKWASLMSKGGYIQIDDYDSFSGCRKAVDEFLASRPDLTLQQFEKNFAKAYFIQT
jgi:O-methyltransferase